MAGASDALRLIREVDGALEWNEVPLVEPGEYGAAAELAQVDTSVVINADSFEITPGGEWLATVAGLEYQVMPAIVIETGNFAFIGVPTGN
jgi:hypothetical protein